jgi:hypothetical protein
MPVGPMDELNAEADVRIIKKDLLSEYNKKVQH